MPVKNRWRDAFGVLRGDGVSRGGPLPRRHLVELGYVLLLFQLLPHGIMPQQFMGVTPTREPTEVIHRR